MEIPEVKEETPVVEKTEEQLLKEKLQEIETKKCNEGIKILQEAVKKINELGCEFVPVILVEGNNVTRIEYRVQIKK